MTKEHAEMSKKRIEDACPGVTVRIEPNGNHFSVVVCVPGGSPSPEHRLDTVEEVNDYIERLKCSGDNPGRGEKREVILPGKTNLRGSEENIQMAFGCNSRAAT